MNMSSLVFEILFFFLVISLIILDPYVDFAGTILHWVKASAEMRFVKSGCAFSRTRYMKE
jgi:hypothetical protein